MWPRSPVAVAKSGPGDAAGDVAHETSRARMMRVATMMKTQTELERLEAARAAWLDSYREPRALTCPDCAAAIGTLFYITWAEQPLMDAMADGALGGVPTQGFYVLVAQGDRPLVPLKGGRRRYARRAGRRSAAAGLGGAAGRGHLRRLRRAGAHPPPPLPRAGAPRRAPGRRRQGTAAALAEGIAGERGSRPARQAPTGSGRGARSIISRVLPSAWRARKRRMRTVETGWPSAAPISA